MSRSSIKFTGPAVKMLTAFANDAVEKSLDQLRIMRVVYAVLYAGVIPSCTLFGEVLERVLSTQHLDGGWSSPEETAWITAVIKALKGSGMIAVERSQKWLDSERLPTGGWGLHSRDKARIPVTGIITALVPEIVGQKDTDWLLNEWQRDFQGSARLSYKAGFFLLASSETCSNKLIAQTLTHISGDQNDDGGFGPWKNHPIGSDPWSTGVVLWGLSRWIHMVDKSVIHRALAWLEKTQLPSGYWPYHYLDDGTSLALIGAVAAMKALASTE